MQHTPFHFSSPSCFSGLMNIFLELFCSPSSQIWSLHLTEMLPLLLNSSHPSHSKSLFLQLNQEAFILFPFWNVLNSCDTISRVATGGSIAGIKTYHVPAPLTCCSSHSGQQQQPVNVAAWNGSMWERLVSMAPYGACKTNGAPKATLLKTCTHTRHQALLCELPTIDINFHVYFCDVGF